MNEAELQVAVARYLVAEYPDVIFHSDFGSGAKLRPYQAKIQKMQNGGRRAWPDLFIACPRVGTLKFGPFITEYNGKGDVKNIRQDVTAPETIRFGLFLELKREGTRIYKKNGGFASDHIREQYMVLEELRERGYEAKFAIGFNEAVNIIDHYLGGNGDVNF